MGYPSGLKHAAIGLALDRDSRWPAKLRTGRGQRRVARCGRRRKRLPCEPPREAIAFDFSCNVLPGVEALGFDAAPRLIVTIAQQMICIC